VAVPEPQPPDHGGERRPNSSEQIAATCRFSLGIDVQKEKPGHSSRSEISCERSEVRHAWSYVRCYKCNGFAVFEISTGGCQSPADTGEGAGVVTGSQIQTARSLLGWDRRHLARACKLRIETLARAESVEGEAPITVAHAQVIRAVLEQAGIEFPTGASTGVALRTKSAA
jgi:hypothetical protein